MIIFSFPCTVLRVSAIFVEHLELSVTVRVKARHLLHLPTTHNPRFVRHGLDEELVVRDANHGTLELLHTFGKRRYALQVEIIRRFVPVR
jgi:hypothetical protein